MFVDEPARRDEPDREGGGHMAAQVSSAEILEEGLSRALGEVAGLVALVFANLAVVMFRIAAMAILASPLLIVWLIQQDAGR
jgi:hypothetical protein